MDSYFIARRTQWTAEEDDILSNSSVEPSTEINQVVTEAISKQKRKYLKKQVNLC